MSRRGRIASRNLTTALLNLAEAGLRTHCPQPETHHYWTSEHEAERAMAALWCNGCPVWVECGTAAEANDERHGVWASVDRTVKPGRKLQRDSEAA